MVFLIEVSKKLIANGNAPALSLRELKLWEIVFDDAGYEEDPAHLNSVLNHCDGFKSSPVLIFSKRSAKDPKASSRLTTRRSLHIRAANRSSSPCESHARRLQHAHQ